MPERARAPLPAPLPAGPAATVRDPLAGRSPFRYSPGTRTYEITSDATIVLVSDTAAHSSTVRTSAMVTLAFEVSLDSLLEVAGSVDRYEVVRGQSIPVPDSTLPSRSSFRAAVASTGKIMSFAGDTAGCSPHEPLLALARRAIVATPAALDAGTRWSDSTSSTVCRGGTPITTGMVSDYEVEAREIVDGVPVARVRRRETFTLAGSSTRDRHPVSITGRGTSNAVLRFDLLHGAFLGEEGSSETTLSISAPRSRTEFQQRERTTVRITGRS